MHLGGQNTGWSYYLDGNRLTVDDTKKDLGVRISSDLFRPVIATAMQRGLHAVVKVSRGPPGARARPRFLELSAIWASAPGWWAPAAAANVVGVFFAQLNDGNTPTADVSSERELTFTFAICYRPSVCRL